MNRDRLYLSHILQACDWLDEYVHEGQDMLRGDHKTQNAALHALQILCESTQRLSPEVRALRPDIDWRAISGLRNIIVHDYLGVDVDVIWRILTEDVPVLRRAIEEMLKGLSDSP